MSKPNKANNANSVQQSPTKVEKSPKHDFSFTAATILMALAIGFMGYLSQQVWIGKIKLHGTTKVTDLKTYVGKLEFLAKYVSVQAIWLMYAIGHAANQRVAAGAANPLSGNKLSHWFFSNETESTVSFQAKNTFWLVLEINYKILSNKCCYRLLHKFRWLHS